MEKTAQGHGWPGPQVADHLGGGQGANPATVLQRQLTGDPVEESGRIEIACPCGVHHTRQRMGGNGMDQPVAKDHRALGAAGEGRNERPLLQLLHGIGNGVHLKEGSDLRRIGEEEIHVLCEHGVEVVSVALDAKTVRQAQGYQAAGLPGHDGSSPEGGLGAGVVKQVALQVEHLGLPD